MFAQLPALPGRRLPLLAQLVGQVELWPWVDWLRCIDLHLTDVTDPHRCFAGHHRPTLERGRNVSWLTIDSPTAALKHLAGDDGRPGAAERLKHDLLQFGVH